MPYDYDVARNRIYFEGSYGFTDGVEAFGRAGASDWVINDIESFQPGLTRDVSSDGYPACVSGGLRGKAWQFGRVSVGGSLEVAWYSGLERAVRWDYDVYQELLFDSTVEITAALSVGCNLGRSVLYGGPLVHFGYNRVDVRTHEFGADWDVEDSVDALTIRDKGGCGGFFGWRAPIGRNGWHLQLEGPACPAGSPARWDSSEAGSRPISSRATIHRRPPSRRKKRADDSRGASAFDSERMGPADRPDEIERDHDGDHGPEEHQSGGWEHRLALPGIKVVSASVGRYRANGVPNGGAREGVVREEAVCLQRVTEAPRRMISCGAPRPMRHH